MRQLLTLLSLLACTNGFAQTPQLACDVRPGSQGSSPIAFTTFQGKLYFQGNDSVGYSLLSYNGTTKQVVPGISPKAIYQGLSGRDMCVFNNKLYLMATSTTVGLELYSYDGITAPKMLFDIEPGSGGSAPHNFTTLNNKLYFAAGTNGYGGELYSYDGTNLLDMHEVRAGLPGTNPLYLTEYKGKLYFSGMVASSKEALCVHDPATAYTGIVQGIDTVSVPKWLYVTNGKLYIMAVASTTGTFELFSYDGTTLTQCSSLAPYGIATTAGNVGNRLMALQGKIYFSNMLLPTSLRQLYRYDIASGGATAVMNTTGGYVQTPTQLTAYAGKIYFAATDSINGTEIWVTDGTSTRMLADLNPGTASSDPVYLYVHNNRLYFSADNGTTGKELYRIVDPAGVEQVSFAGSVRLFPNPAGQHATLEVTLQQSYLLSLHLTDASGRTVLTKPGSQYQAGKTNIELELGALSGGVYFYDLCDARGAKVAAGSFIKD